MILTETQPTTYRQVPEEGGNREETVWVSGELERGSAPEVVRAWIAESGRLARKLHDGVSQYCTAVSAQLYMLESTRDEAQGKQIVSRLRHIVDTLSQEVRFLLRELRTNPHQNSNLQVVFETAAEYARSSGLHATLDVKGCRDLPVSPEEYYCVRRAVNEAVQNAISHSKGQNLSIRVSREDNLFSVQVIDDGKGFDPEVIFSTREAGGLIDIAAAMNLWRGIVTLRTAPGQGTHIQFSLPINEHANQADSNSNG